MALGLLAWIFARLSSACYTLPLDHDCDFSIVALATFLLPAFLVCITCMLLLTADDIAGGNAGEIDGSHVADIHPLRSDLHIGDEKASVG